MAYELIHKQIVKVMCIILIILALCGCDRYAGKYPYEKADHWICEEPYIEIKYTRSGNGTFIEESILEWNGEIIKVDIDFGYGNFVVQPDGNYSYEARLFDGICKFRNGNVILVIEDDFIFNNQFAELVLIPVEIE